MGELAQIASLTQSVESLTAAARRSFEYWRAIIEPLLENPPTNLSQALKELARVTGQTAKTLQNKYYDARNHGILAVADKRLCSKLWKRKKAATPRVKESEGLISLWKRLCEESDRSMETAHKRLLKMWKNRDEEFFRIPEYRDFPHWPALPPGLRYRNLLRYAPTEFELVVAQRGRSAAKGLRPTMRTTRVGLYVGSHYMIDDMWHNVMVNSFADKQAGRPMEIYTLDYFSACKMRWGARVRVKGRDGKYQGLSEVHARYITAATLFLDGYSPRGTEMVTEHGTAHLTERVVRALHDVSGGLITCSASGLQHEAAHAGQYPVFKLGNPNFKAALESNHNLYQNRMDYLPGQTGKNRDDRPAELAARLEHNARLLDLREALPEHAREGMVFPVLEFGQYLHLCSLACAGIEDERDHQLAEWIEAGNFLQMVDFGGGLTVPDYKLNEEQRAKLPALMDAGMVRVYPERMTRLEARRRGARDLVKIPGWGVCAILGDDLAREVKLGNDGFHVEDIDLSPSPLLYSPVIRDAEGRERILRKGEKFDGFINPFAPEVLFVRDAQGRYLGESKILPKPSRGDRDGIVRAWGEYAHVENVMAKDVQARHGRSGTGEGAGRARMGRDKNVAGAGRSNKPALARAGAAGGGNIFAIDSDDDEQGDES
ncbi:hypothetical protein OpiT1DRAFT_03997 [Opitutaceae bacterium TAV1]|nr:hypothetical protein OpiT1DRAFT_03997 [Opitutaceae bacterium TAV1]